MPADLAYYEGLIPSQHRFLPKFSAVVSLMTQGFVEQQTMLGALPAAFDLDLAEGPQLDVVGEWVGISRQLPVLITDVYLEWDGLATLGFDAGFWQGPFDPDAGPTNLGDADYRNLIKTKIRVNYWDGSFEQLLSIWNDFLPADRIGMIVDGQDMTLSFGYEGGPLEGVQAALLTIALGMLKPSAVRIKEVFAAVDGTPLLVWDSPGGWDTNAWSILLES